MKKINNQTNAYQLLKDMIMKAELKPGEKISKNALVKKFEIGDTPVREAILRLQEENLLVVIPQSGTYVSYIDLQEVSEARFMRSKVEVAIMEEAVDLITTDQIEELKQMVKIQKIYFDSKNSDSYFELDEKFHCFFYQITNKNHIWKWLQSINTSLNRYRFLRLEVKELSWENILNEHEEILRLVNLKDKKQLEQIIERHVHKTDEDITSVIQAFPDFFVEKP